MFVRLHNFIVHTHMCWLQLLFTALEKLPSLATLVYRGVPLDLKVIVRLLFLVEGRGWRVVVCFHLVSSVGGDIMCAGAHTLRKQCCQSVGQDMIAHPGEACTHY